MTTWNRIVWLSSWVLPPVGMALAYTILAWSSETDNTGKAWMAVGFGFVLILWIVFRIAVDGAGVSRALAVGDSDRLMTIVNKQLARRTSEPSRAPFLIYKAIAHEQRGEHAEAVAAVSEAKPVNDRDALLGASVRAIALVETGKPAEARALVGEIETRSQKVDRRLQPMPHHYAHLARARILAAEGDRAGAEAELDKVINDIRTGAALRAQALSLRGVTT